MQSRNNLNVYKGPDSVKDYFNPDRAPPLPLVELPNSLNPYRKDGVRIYAKMMTMHPANNVKSMPALNLLEHGIAPDKTKTVVEYSSGSTVISMALMSRVLYDLGDVHAFLSNKTTAAKLKLMQFFGLNITLFGGPSQPEPNDERGGIRAAYRWAQESESVLNPDQYNNDLNWQSHMRWTGPQILEQLPEISLICAGMGTSGTLSTMSGLGSFFKEKNPSVFRLGVCTAAGDRVPGPRSLALLAPVNFPWKSAVDHIEEVASHPSYSLSLELCRNGIVCGPSSGFNLQGLYQFIEKRKKEGTLSQLAGEDGQIHCVTLCCDLPYQYMDEYFAKLEAEQFPPIRNSELSDVDLYRYDSAWEKDPLMALNDFYRLDKVLTRDLLFFLSKRRSDERQGWERIIAPSPDTIVVDLRQPEDFDQFSLPGSVNFPLIQSGTPSPFTDPKVLASLWRELEAKLSSENEDICSQLRDKLSLIICYDGDSARVATSVLRAKGYAADSMNGGIRAMRKVGLQLEDPCGKPNFPARHGQSVGSVSH
ncbi:cysteine synthase A [Colletotrichum abscissum]|uniref:Cysteine synthase A n=1 Tax=Colletotrichum abscissum TaxID=1671311 RepID=A0A9P9XGQ6_9PEZI|nr:cysteine synthase A [Colletotrichum abscissum]